jgi:hypothetical protein
LLADKAGEGSVILSPAAQALGWSVGSAGEVLREQVDERAEELRKKRQQQAKTAGYSPAGVALSGMGLLGGVGMAGAM